MRPFSPACLSGPDIADLAATGIATPLTQLAAVVFDPASKGLKELADNLVGIGVVGQVDILRQTEIHSDGQYPGILISSQIDDVLETSKVLPDERPFLDHYGKAFEGVVVVQAEIGVVGMTERVAIGDTGMAGHGYDS